MPNRIPTAVIALGGNAISRKGEEDTIANQFRHTRESLSAILPFIHRGYNLAISHGNGPQVGNAILRVELSRGKAPILPLGICVADTEGGMGYMIAQSLQNRLQREGIDRAVAAILTQVEVDRNDPAMANPTKYIGQFYEEEQAKRFAKERGWQVKRDGDRGWRRVVASPIPKAIVEGPVIRAMVNGGAIVIAAGGGGIPVYYEDDGRLEGLDVVIDKDRASAVLAKEIGAEMLIILTDADNAYLNYGKPDQRALSRVTVAEAKQYASEGHFPPGSMGPKIEAALTFLESGGEKVIITSIEQSAAALDEKAGTIIVPD